MVVAEEKEKYSVLCSVRVTWHDEYEGILMKQQDIVTHVT